MRPVRPDLAEAPLSFTRRCGREHWIPHWSAINLACGSPGAAWGRTGRGEKRERRPTTFSPDTHLASHLRHLRGLSAASVREHGACVLSSRIFSRSASSVEEIPLLDSFYPASGESSAEVGRDESPLLGRGISSRASSAISKTFDGPVMPKRTSPRRG